MGLFSALAEIEWLLIQSLGRFAELFRQLTSRFGKLLLTGLSSRVATGGRGGLFGELFGQLGLLLRHLLGLLAEGLGGAIRVVGFQSTCGLLGGLGSLLRGFTGLLGLPRHRLLGSLIGLLGELPRLLRGFRFGTGLTSRVDGELGGFACQLSLLSGGLLWLCGLWLTRLGTVLGSLWTGRILTVFLGESFLAKLV